MRLRPPPHIPVPPPPPKKRYFWGRFIYLSLLGVAAYAGLRWGAERLRYIQAPGVLKGDSVNLESPVAARIVRMSLKVGQKVAKGDRLVHLDIGDIEQQIAGARNKIQELEASYQLERRQLPLLIQEQRTRLTLQQDGYNLRRLQIKSELTQNKLQYQEYEQKLTRQKRQFEQVKELKRLKAATKLEYQTVQQQVEEAQAKLAQLQAKSEALEQEFTQIGSSLARLDEEQAGVASQIQGRSKLAFYEAQLTGARRELGLLIESVKRRELFSPIYGIVSAVYGRVGEVAMPGEALAVITAAQNLHLEVFFEAEQQMYLKPGLIVEVLFDNQRRSRGVISRLHPATDAIPPEFQARLDPPRQALVAEIYPPSPGDWGDWPDTCGLGARVFIKRRLF